MQQCQTESGRTLVSIETQEERDFLKKELTKNSPQPKGYFIALKKIVGKWRWISGNRTVDASYELPWGAHKPVDDCVKMYFKDGTVIYDDITCDRYSLSGFIICEKHDGCQVMKGLGKRNILV